MGFLLRNWGGRSLYIVEGWGWGGGVRLSMEYVCIGERKVSKKWWKGKGKGGLDGVEVRQFGVDES